MSIQFLGIKAGPEGIAQTLAHMRDLVLESDKHREVKLTAANIIKDVLPQDHKAQVEAIVSWVRKRIKYVRDIQGVEEVSAPHVLIAQVVKSGVGYGDCDDFSVLLSALLRAVGFRTRLEALAVNQDMYNHARLAVYLNDEWISIEGTRPWAIGRRYPSQMQVMYVEP